MAWSVSSVDKTILGNKRVYTLSCVADAATQAVDTGLSVVDFFVTGVKSCTTGAVKLYQNKNASGVATNGYIGASGFVSGDEILITVFGR